MQKKLFSNPGFAIFADLYFDRFIYATLIAGALFSGMLIHSM
jgi:hypothetical protein